MSTLKVNKSKKIATGWWMVIACILVQAIPYCIVGNTQALYMYPVMQAKGFTVQQFSLIFTIGTLVPALIGPFIGSIYSKVNLKMFYLFGGILLGGGFMTFSMAVLPVGASVEGSLEDAEELYKDYGNNFVAEYLKKQTM